MNLKEEIKKELEKQGKTKSPISGLETFLYCNAEKAIENIVLKYRDEILKKVYNEDDYIKEELSKIKNVNSKDWYYVRGSLVQNNDLLLFIENSLKT